LSQWKRVADLWCACWFSPGSGHVPVSAFGALSDAIVSGSGAMPANLADRYLRAADEIARARRLFHWELEFPEAFFNADGSRLEHAGFDAVIGNPPWDMIRADAGTVESRVRARTDIAPVLRVTRDAGVYTVQSGDPPAAGSRSVVHAGRRSRSSRTVCKMMGSSATSGWRSGKCFLAAFVASLPNPASTTARSIKYAASSILNASYSVIVVPPGSGVRATAVSTAPYITEALVWNLTDSARQILYTSRHGTIHDRVF
jgi:hypothetical protein